MAKKIHFKKTEEIRQKSVDNAADNAIDAWVRNEEKPKYQQISSHKIEENVQRLSINLPEELHRKLKNMCALEGISIKEKVMALLERELGL